MKALFIMREEDFKTGENPELEALSNTYINVTKVGHYTDRYEIVGLGTVVYADELTFETNAEKFVDEL